jgi:hypothetical protein
MLTDQGELWADCLSLKNNIKKTPTNLLAAYCLKKEFTQTSLTINALLVYGWGNNI